MGHSDEWTFADYFRYEKEIYRAIISAAVLCQWIAEHDTPPTDGEAEELVREIDRRLCEAWGEIRPVSLQKIDAAPYAKRSAEAHNDGLQSINCTIEKFHKFTSINSDRDGVWVQKSRHT